jgi:hypothetical protein
MVFMAVADQHEFEILAVDASGFHHADQILALPEASGIHQKGFVGHDRIIPGRPQIPVPAVKILGGKPEYFESGGQLKLDDHFIAAFVALGDNLINVLLQICSSSLIQQM